MTPEMQQLVDDAWRVMDGPVPSSHQACTACCMTPENDALFFRTPRRALPVTFFDDWYSAAFSAPAAPELRRYLLPRVLELMAQGVSLGLGTELMLYRFDTGVPDLWSPAEQEVIARFVRLFLDLQAVPDSPWGCLDDVLCMFALAGHDMEPLLAQVRAWPDAALVTKLHADWCRSGGLWLWHTAFWNSKRPGVAEAEAQVMAWYRAPWLRDRCFDACCDDTQPEAIQSMAGQLYDGLQHI